MEPDICLIILCYFLVFTPIVWGCFHWGSSYSQFPYSKTVLILLILSLGWFRFFRFPILSIFRQGIVQRDRIMEICSDFFDDVLSVIWWVFFFFLISFNLFYCNSQIMILQSLVALTREWYYRNAKTFQPRNSNIYFMRITLFTECTNSTFES